MATLVTNGIRISVETYYNEEHSVPLKNKFVFAYRITIENESEHTVQLMRRHWFIFDSIGAHREVEGEGVIGKQPILQPGQSHQYVSWCPLLSGVGKMHGTYQMRKTSTDEEFVVRIPEFQLLDPILRN